MKPKTFLVPILTVLSLMIIPISASADKTGKLIDLLIKKGIVTSEEARHLEQQLEAEEKAEQAKTAADRSRPLKGLSGNVEVKYDGGAVIKTTDDRYSLKLNARIQPLFSHRDFDTGDDSTTFRIRRARILARGNAFYPWLKYGMQVTLEGAGASMRDGSIEASYFKWLKPKIGQFKIPFDREFLAPGFDLQLIERSLANAEFSLQRDIGLQLSGQKIADVLEYRIGIFNGSGANRTNVDDDLMYTGRVVLTPFGRSYTYSQAALDMPDMPQLAIGLAAAFMPGLESGERATLAGRLGDIQIVPVESDVYQSSVDLAFKYRGFSLEAGYYNREIDPKDATTFGKQDADGYYIQAGYFLIPKHLEIATRYSFVVSGQPEPNSQQRTRGSHFGRKLLLLRPQAEDSAQLFPL